MVLRSLYADFETAAAQARHTDNHEHPRIVWPASPMRKPWILMKQDYRGVAGLCFRSITNTPAPFVPPNVWMPKMPASSGFPGSQVWAMLASLPGVLYETLAHPIGIENPIPRRMVLASGFRGSMLRLPLSGMVYCEIATRTLDLRACNPRRGRREDRAVKKCPITYVTTTKPCLPTPPGFSATYLCQKE